MSEPDAFDQIMASLDPPMVVVTAAVQEERAGCLIGFHTQGSIHPRRYAIWLSKANHTFRVAFLAQHVALHFLTRDDLDLADLFGTNSGDDMDKFALCEWAPSAEGPPLLLRCPNRVILRRTGVLDEGSDHMCFVAEPVAAFAPTRFEPLRLSDVSHLEPGHAVDERPLPATTRAAD